MRMSVWIRDILVRIRMRIQILGSVIQYHWLTDLDADTAPDLALFVSDLQDANNKLFFSVSFYAYSFLKVQFIILHRKKVIKKSQDSGNHGFSLFFYLLIEGSGTGSVQGDYGYRRGSSRPKNLPIQNQMRIRITVPLFLKMENSKDMLYV